MSIVNEVDNTLNTYFNEDTSPDVMRWLANVVYNDNQKLQALSPVNVNPDVLDLASQYVECYLALSKFLNDAASFKDNCAAYEQNSQDDFLSGFVAGFVGGFLGGLFGDSDDSVGYIPAGSEGNYSNALSEMQDMLSSNWEQISNYYQGLIERTEQLRMQLFP